jgi:hypothetical protein
MPGFSRALCPIRTGVIIYVIMGYFPLDFCLEANAEKTKGSHIIISFKK